MTDQILLNRLRVLTVLAALGSVSFLVLGLLTFGAIQAKVPNKDVSLVWLYWLSTEYWVGFSFYIARARFRSWKIAAISGLGMLLWFGVGPAILGQFPDLVTYILSDFDWIERWAADEASDQMSLVLASTIGMLPFFAVISLIWGLFPMLLSSWPRRKNTVQTALA